MKSWRVILLPEDVRNKMVKSDLFTLQAHLSATCSHAEHIARRRTGAVLPNSDSSFLSFAWFRRQPAPSNIPAVRTCTTPQIADGAVGRSHVQQWSQILRQIIRRLKNEARKRISCSQSRAPYVKKNSAPILLNQCNKKREYYAARYFVHLSRVTHAPQPPLSTVTA